MIGQIFPAKLDWLRRGWTARKQLINSVTDTSLRSRTLNGFAKLETKARSAIAKVGADDLIARPQ